jgi:hypothetical protein
MSSPGLSKGEFFALGAIAKGRQENLRNLFDGTELTFAKYSRQKCIKNALSDAASLASQTEKLIKGVKTGSKTASAISQAGDIHTNANEFIQIASGITDYSDVVHAVGSEVLHSLVSEMTPFIGVITSSLKAASSWRAVVANARDIYKSDYYLKGVLPGDPEAAAEAVVETIKRFLAANTVDAVANTASAATKIAGLFADLGTATTAAVGAARAAA